MKRIVCSSLYLWKDICFETNTKFLHCSNSWCKNSSKLDNRMCLLWSEFCLLAKVELTLKFRSWRKKIIHTFRWKIEMQYLWWYRVSHLKVHRVILLCWRYKFWFLLMFWILYVHEIGPFMLHTSIFIQMIMHAIYGPKCKKILLLN